MGSPMAAQWRPATCSTPWLAERRAEPWFPLGERFAEIYDQTAFDPDYDTFPLEHFEPLVRKVFARAQMF